MHYKTSAFINIFKQYLIKLAMFIDAKEVNKCEPLLTHWRQVTHI